jgi:hypothetical protein
MLRGGSRKKYFRVDEKRLDIGIASRYTTHMKLLTPTMFRLKPAQDAWLRARAEKQGHGNKSLALRLLLDRAMASKEVRRQTRLD